VLVVAILFNTISWPRRERVRLLSGSW